MGQPHKWAKEIKAWADGAEIEIKYGEHDWVVEHYPNWHSDEVKYRIKVETEGCKACVTCGQLVEQPQPKEVPPFLGMKEIPYKHWVLRFYKMPNDLWYTEGIDDEWMNEMIEASKPQPKEPQYLYVYGDGTGSAGVDLHKMNTRYGQPYIGKIKLETDE